MLFEAEFATVAYFFSQVLALNVWGEKLGFVLFQSETDFGSLTTVFFVYVVFPIYLCGFGLSRKIAGDGSRVLFRNI